MNKPELRRTAWPRRCRRRETGFAVVYAALLLVVMLALASLAVDLGRAQCAKTELQRAADAAARYGVQGIDDGTAVNKAIAAAADNLVDGTRQVLSNQFADTPRDVEVGNWDATLNPSFSTARLPANAVRVTAHRSAARGTAIPLLFARAFGSNSCDLLATSIALRGETDPNFVGLKRLGAKNNTSAGYDPRLGTPDVGTTSGASIASNGAIEFGNNPAISGSVLLGPDGSYSGTSPTPQRLPQDLSYPATENAPSLAAGALNVNGTVHVAGGGTLSYSSIVMGNGSLLVFDQPTTVYVTEGITFNQNGEIRPASGLPSDLRIRIIGSAVSTVGGNNSNSITITGQIYAPNTDFVANNNGELRGTALFRSISARNTLSLYYDITSKSVVSGLTGRVGGIVTVQ